MFVICPKCRNHRSTIPADGWPGGFFCCECEVAFLPQPEFCPSPGNNEHDANEPNPGNGSAKRKDKNE